ncbi:MAG: TonB-dependent receptor plug domain-containing protein, partial [Verrucomicrobiota bacterium]|nr:TonB-dependent receptor plug domain-containing protein [Verrucomicrobiota bacterium]
MREEKILPAIIDIDVGVNKADEDEVYVLPEFVVSNESDEGYYSANTTSISRTNSLVKNTPISLSIINEQLLEDLNITSTEELAMVNASIDEDPNGFSLDRIRIRGFRSEFSQYNFFKRNVPSDNYNVARVDIIKGANSLIFGEASPGGTVNSVPMLANFGSNSQAFTQSFGNKDYQRTVFNINQIISDNAAIRMMGVRNLPGYDHSLKSSELEAFTLAATLKLNRNTQARLHLENVDTFNRFPTRAMRDKTRRDDDNDPNNGYQGILSSADFSQSITKYEVPFSPDWVEYLPQQAMDWLIDHTKDNTYVDPITSREDLIDHYSLINRENYGSVSGPDRYSQRDGIFLMADVEHKFSDKVVANLSLNYQAIEGEGLGREAESSVMVRDAYDTRYGSYPRPSQEVDDQFIRTFWQKNDSDTDRFALRSSVVFQDEIFNVENRFIVGFDFAEQNKEESFYDQVPVGARGALVKNLGAGYTQLAEGAYIPVTRVATNSVNDQFRAYEYISLNKPFTVDRSILRFNELIESDNIMELPFGIMEPGDFVHLDYPNAEWALARNTDSKIRKSSLWFADICEFLDGRIHTLVGLRYDQIQVDSSFRKVFLHGYDTGIDDGNNNESSEVYDQLNPTIGGLFWLNENFAIFGNYACSIKSPSGTERTPLGEIAPPELGQGYEAGIRFELMEGKLDGQFSLYRIIKENDNEFRYSDGLLRSIYTYDLYGAEHPELFNLETVNKNLITSNLPGRRSIGDETRSDGLELDFTYNPTKRWSFIASYNYSLANEIEKLHPLVENPDDFKLFGRPDHRATLTARYKFTDGPLRNLVIGASQRFRSASVQTRFELPYDDNNDGEVDREEKVDLKFGDELTTSLFATWNKKLGTLRSSPVLYLSARVNNVFDDRDFTGR